MAVGALASQECPPLEHGFESPPLIQSVNCLFVCQHYLKHAVDADICKEGWNAKMIDSPTFDIFLVLRLLWKSESSVTSSGWMLIFEVFLMRPSPLGCPYSSLKASTLSAMDWCLALVTARWWGVLGEKDEEKRTVAAARG